MTGSSPGRAVTPPTTLVPPPYGMSRAPAVGGEGEQVAGVGAADRARHGVRDGPDPSGAHGDPVGQALAAGVADASLRVEVQADVRAESRRGDGRDDVLECRVALRGARADEPLQQVAGGRRQRHRDLSSPHPFQRRIRTSGAYRALPAAPAFRQAGDDGQNGGQGIAGQSGRGAGSGRSASSAVDPPRVARTSIARRAARAATRRGRRRGPSRIRSRPAISSGSNGVPRQPHSTVRSFGHRREAHAVVHAVDVAPAVDRQDVAALAVGVVHRPRRGPPSGAAAGRPRRPWPRRRPRGPPRRTPGPSPRRTARRAGSSAGRCPSRSPRRRARRPPRGGLSVPSGKSSSGRSPSVGL